jgi:chloride channel protein, CIC family
MPGGSSKLRKYPRLRKYSTLAYRDLSSVYSRDLHEWLLVAPMIGVVTGLVITLIAKIILDWMWPGILRYYIAHPLAMLPGLLAGFVIAGLLMQYLTPDPDEHSTEEIIRSYHEHQGDIQMRPFIPKLLAAIATVGFGGSAALEGPSIYGGGALGSWLWSRFRRFQREPRTRRIMLISGAAAGMAAVFRAPLTGIIFALEMPYKDDLAHEALLPSLLASVVSYVTLAFFLGPGPLFNFVPSASFSGKDLVWSALLGLICGLVAMIFDRVYRRARSFSVAASLPHWVKMAIGGVMTAICGLIFLLIFKGSLVPIGPNYEAVPEILLRAHRSVELVVFAALKLLATLFSLGVGGVSAMFVPLFLTGESIGAAFAQSVAHSSSIDLYAAVGMAAFIAAGYKTPLTAVVFVAEATGGHSYIIPALIGAAVAYAVSGEASVSGDQRLHESVPLAELEKIPVGEVMQRQVLSVEASATLREFSDSVSAHYLHAAYPVYQDHEVVGVIAIRSLAKVPVEKWEQTAVADVANRRVTRVPPECDLMEALRLLTAQRGQPMLLVTSADGKLEGILTQADILSALRSRQGDGGVLRQPA